MERRVIAVSAIILVLIVALWPQKPKKTTEDGVEVIWNPLEPSEAASKQSPVFLEEELRIDLGKTDLVEAGLAEPVAFDVDSEGNIYVSTQRSSTDFIFKLDKTGKFLTSFGRKGQGPGELQFPTFARFSPKEELFIVDQRRRKLVVFSKTGHLIREIPVEYSTPIIWPLSNDRYLGSHYEYDPEAEHSISRLLILDGDWRRIAELDPTKSVNMARAKKVDGVDARSILAVTPKYIFLGNSERGYEIRVYNHESLLLKKIKKAYKPVRVDEAFRDNVRKRYARAPEILQKLYFSKNFPPFQFGFADETGSLFVMTYEKGKNTGEFIYDVFNPDGVFVARTALPNYGRYGVVEAALFAMARKGRIYCFREKESGFKEIVVYKINRKSG
jgi:hypothetical protein